MAGTVFTRRIFGRDSRAGLVAGLSAGYGNTTLIGLPLILLKLIAMPALALVLARLVRLPPMVTKVAVIAAACPTGVTPFLVAGRFRTGEGLASTTITMSTLLAVASVALWLKIVDWL
jgi:hypothetical protein